MDSHSDSAMLGSFRQSSWRVLAEYTGVVLLALAAASISFHAPALTGVRFALNFCVIAAAALAFGTGPAIAALLVAALVLQIYQPLRLDPHLHGREPLLASSVVLLAIGLLLLLIQRRHATENKLRTLVAQLQQQAGALVESQQASRAAAWTFDTRTGSTTWYPGGEEVFGHPHSDIVALGSASSFVLEEDRPLLAQAIEHTTRTGKPFAAEFRVLWPNGEVHWLEARGTPLPSSPELWRGATIDITDRKRSEQALIRTEKLAIAGRLAASIAHEINNPLEAVINLCYLARISSTEPETVQYIAMAEEELSRVAHITSQTLRFHRQQTAPSNTDLNDLVRSIVTLYQQKLTDGSVIVRLDARPAPPLLCYAGEIRQVIANLIGNAADAMPRGGTLRIVIRPSIQWKTGAPAVRLAFADTGSGIPPESLSRIFEPFYTTKAETGTGLGLWVSATLIEKHHGQLTVRSLTTPGRSGTVFSLVLPYSSAPTPNPTPSPSS